MHSIITIPRRPGPYQYGGGGGHGLTIHLTLHDRKKTRLPKSGESAYIAPITHTASTRTHPLGSVMLMCLSTWTACFPSPYCRARLTASMALIALALRDAISVAVCNMDVSRRVPTTQGACWRRQDVERGGRFVKEDFQRSVIVAYDVLRDQLER